MMGLETDGGRPLVRAYSMASPNYEDTLEFFSIKVPDGPLTSRLQHIKASDRILVSKKPTGTLVVDNLLPGRFLYLLSTGTGPGAVHEHHPRPRDLRALREGRAGARLPAGGRARLRRAHHRGAAAATS